MIEIPLTRGKTTIIDDMDADLLRIKWNAHQTRKRFYAEHSKQIGRPRLKLHRIVMERILGPFAQGCLHL